MRRFVRDDPMRPDPGFAELYASLPDATDLEPWLGWCRAAAGPVLYLGVGAGRLAAPLAAAGITLVGVDAHPGMLRHLGRRLPGVELVQCRIEDLALERRFDLVMAPSSVLDSPGRLAAAARHVQPGGRVALELMNPHWLLAGAAEGVRVVHAGAARVQLEVDYPGGWTQLADVALRWPEDTERFLAAAGLRLELMRGRDEDADLAATPAYYVLARPRPRVPRASRRGWYPLSRFEP